MLEEVASSGGCSEPAQARRAPRSRRHGALGALRPLGSPASVQEVSLEWEVGSETRGASSGGDEMLQEVSWAPVPTLTVGSRAQPNLSFFCSLSRGTNKRRKSSELNAHTSQDHQGAPQSQHL